jgi:hypothetical protein
VTDDPEPVEFRHWEVYLAAQHFSARDGVSGSAPLVDLNYGAWPGLQLPWVPGQVDSSDIEDGRAIRLCRPLRLPSARRSRVADPRGPQPVAPMSAASRPPTAHTTPRANLVGLRKLVAPGCSEAASPQSAMVDCPYETFGRASFTRKSSMDLRRAQILQPGQSDDGEGSCYGHGRQPHKAG